MTNAVPPNAVYATIVRREMPLLWPTAATQPDRLREAEAHALHPALAPASEARRRSRALGALAMTAGLAVAGMRCGNCRAPFMSARAGQKYCSRVCRQRAHYLDGNSRRQSEPGAVPLYDVALGGGAVSLPAEAATRVPGRCAQVSAGEMPVQEECSLALAPASARDGCDDEVDGGYIEPDRPRPATLGPVAHRGRMVRREGERRAGYQPENHEWRDWLCDTELVSS